MTKTREEILARKRAYNKVYYSKNQKELVIKKREYRDENRELVNKFQREYVARNKETVMQRQGEYYIKNKDKIRAKRKANADKLREYAVSYRLRNKDNIRNYERNRYRNSPQYRISVTLRARIRDAVKREHKSAKTEDLLGITFCKFKQYLESKFKDGMTWENYGQWEIDHTMPLASFDLTKESQQREAFHFTNTQPLWLKENRLKSAKILN